MPFIEPVYADVPPVRDWERWIGSRRQCDGPGCTAEFVTNGARDRLYCSARCRQRASRARLAPYRAEERAEERLLQDLWRECAGCGEGFTPKRADAVYCSGRCRVAAHRARRRIADALEARS